MSLAIEIREAILCCRQDQLAVMIDALMSRCSIEILQHVFEVARNFLFLYHRRLVSGLGPFLQVLFQSSCRLQTLRFDARWAISSFTICCVLNRFALADLIVSNTMLQVCKRWRLRSRDVGWETL